MSVIPSFCGANAPLTRKAFDRAVSKMPNFRTVDPDGIAAEAINYCPAAKDALRLVFELVNTIWEEEKLPDGFTMRNSLCYSKIRDLLMIQVSTDTLHC